MIKTVAVTAGTETKVEISGGYNVGIVNFTTDMLYASRKSGVVAGADDVAAIPAGDSYVIRAADDTVYLLATAAGDVQLESIGAKEVFKIAAARSSSGGGEGGTVDDVARQAIASHANNGEIHLTAEKAIEAAASAIGNPNMLINPELCAPINQRGQSSYSGRQYTIDHWYASTALAVNVGERVSISANGGTGFFEQYFEKTDIYDNKPLALSVYLSDGTALFATGICPEAGEGSSRTMFIRVPLPDGNDVRVYRGVTTDRISLICQLRLADGTTVDNVDALKLEMGDVATVFSRPDSTLELLKCQRYYQIRSTGDISPVDLRPSMGTITDVKERSDGSNYEYIAEL